MRTANKRWNDIWLDQIGHDQIILEKKLTEITVSDTKIYWHFGRCRRLTPVGWHHRRCRFHWWSSGKWQTAGKQDQIDCDWHWWTHGRPTTGTDTHCQTTQYRSATKTKFNRSTQMNDNSNNRFEVRSQIIRHLLSHSLSTHALNQSLATSLTCQPDHKSGWQVRMGAIQLLDYITFHSLSQSLAHSLTILIQTIKQPTRP